jgi:hypothetical protein
LAYDGWSDEDRRRWLQRGRLQPRR